MKNEQLYNKTIGILIKAYQEDTLRHGDCKACAVGNICESGSWSDVFVTTSTNKDISSTSTGHRIKGDMIQRIRPSFYNIDTYVKQVIDTTGYTWQELADIEFAFETADKGQSDDDWMFNGLMDVVDVLNRIHEVENKELSKELFIKV